MVSFLAAAADGGGRPATKFDVLGPTHRPYADAGQDGFETEPSAKVSASHHFYGYYTHLLSAVTLQIDSY